MPQQGRAPGSKRWTDGEIEEFFALLKARNPRPDTELEYKTHYTLLVAVVLSAQATDKSVNQATRHIFPTIDTPEKMIAFGEAKLRNAIKTIGLFRTKAKNVIALSKILVAKYGGEIPRTREELQELPGVGRKTANVVLNVAFGEHTIAVDTHIFRVSNRTELAPGKTPLEVETNLEARVPIHYKRHAHHWLILHGRYICVARTPKCPECAVKHLCRYPTKTPPADAMTEAANSRPSRAKGTKDPVRR